MVVVVVCGEREVLAEALVAVLALEGLVHRGHLARLGGQLVDDCLDGWHTRFSNIVQGDYLGCAKPPVDIDVKVAF